jgi:pantoate--beta-alanine ligase
MSASPVLLRGRAALRACSAALKAQGLSLGFVPTMGALHDGHLSLVRLAGQEADRTLVSIFVNPAQFAPHEDLDRYPRTEAADIDRLASVGCDFVYIPAVEEMYPPGAVTRVRVPGVSEPLEGVFRPHFFEGVATVVAKLLIQAGADVAVFGEKDWQQLQVIRRLVADLDIPTRIVAGPTLRDPDGLAMSSRNAYLSPDARARAVALPRALEALAAHLKSAGRVDEGVARAQAALRDAGFDRIDYVAAADPETLLSLGPGPVDQAARLLAAAWLGGTRLIDNCPV